MHRSELVPRGLAIEAFWELSVGVYLAVKGFRPSSPVLRDQGAQSAPVA